MQTVTLLPYNANPLHAIAEDILHKYKNRLPDLSPVVILLPDPASHADMRKALLDAAKVYGYAGLIGMHITSLHQWIDDNHQCDRKKIGAHERELVLVDALRAHPDLPGAKQPWLLAENLLKLFDELNLQHVQLDKDEASFNRQLRKAYGLDIDTANGSDDDLLTHLDREAQLVHRLWHAWHQQLDSQQADDSLGIYHHKLHTSIMDKDDEHEYWLAGYPCLSSVEQQWFDSKASDGRAQLFKQASSIPTEDSDWNHTRFIDQVYASEHYDFAERASAVGHACPASPLKERIRIVAAENEELQACSVELQVRQWLTTGRQNIGIVTQDRRLARRVRALLDRANVSLKDGGGWALSTTSAAAALERWLECIEQEFDHVALLDLLKTPFVFGDIQGDDYLKTIYRFEQDIIQHENISSGLQRYQWALASREERLKELWSTHIFSSVRELLSTLEEASRPLLPFTHNKLHDPGTFIERLIESMKTIGMYEAMDSDPAGQRVLHELENMQSAIGRQPLKMRWSEIRSWIGRTLERFSFKPDTSDNRVTLLDLQQAQLTQFDAVILAGADQNHLPGPSSQQAFFNDAVRFSLGLPGADEYQELQFHYYLCLLNQAPEIVITHHRASSEGESVIISPWVEALNNFHKLAYGDDLEDHSLNRLLAGGHSGVINDGRKTIPLADKQPAPATPVQLLPEHLSASSYQQIIDCPYKFFSARLLRLSASDEVSEVLSKTEYGERVHLCLEAFHGDVEHRPGPFPEKLSDNNRDKAITLLEEIARNVFSADISNNFEHRGWLERFINHIPAYIKWQIKHNTVWDIQETEATIEMQQATLPMSLKGRLDRIDQNENGLDIIDYKTGYTPTQGDVNAGEAVQLPFYAMLGKQPVYRVEYLQLDQGKVSTKAKLEGDDLKDMVEKNTARLNELIDSLNKQHDLPAWGDEDACRYCDMSGLCRRDNWLGEEDNS